MLRTLFDKTATQTAHGRLPECTLHEMEVFVWLWMNGLQGVHATKAKPSLTMSFLSLNVRKLRV